jgi:ABC-type branched-subunit amino acid transport system ATPase component
MPTSSDRPSSGGPPHRPDSTPPGPAAPADGPAPGQRGRPRPVLTLDDVAAGYGGAPIVSGVRISAGPGEVVSVIGPNGAGKSTLLKAVTGRLPVMAGRVTLNDRDVTNMRGHLLARRGLGYVPQARDVFDTLTVTENLEMGGYLLTKAQVAARIESALATFPALAGARSRTAGKLSGGERKMLAMARVLMLEPAVLILDEPTSNLSAELSRSVLRDQVRRLADAGTAVLLVEQKAFEALGVSDWAYILVAGRVEIAGPAGEIRDRPDIREVFLGQSAQDPPSPPGDPPSPPGDPPSPPGDPPSPSAAAGHSSPTPA